MPSRRDIPAQARPSASWPPPCSPSWCCACCPPAWPSSTASTTTASPTASPLRRPGPSVTCSLTPQFRDSIPGPPWSPAWSSTRWVAAALALAVFFNRRFAGARFGSSLVFLPIAVPPAVSSRHLEHPVPAEGPLNTLLHTLGLPTALPPGPSRHCPLIVLMSWVGVGYWMTASLIAGLQDIPGEGLRRLRRRRRLRMAALHPHHPAAAAACPQPSSSSPTPSRTSSCSPPRPTAHPGRPRRLDQPDDVDVFRRA
ncbi:hypothetical protein LV779_24745 [Streptomyces thinghirensis]|nr:hypothetical protein [Streptomyces thinghirensis]